MDFHWILSSTCLCSPAKETQLPIDVGYRSGLYKSRVEPTTPAQSTSITKSQATNNGSLHLHTMAKRHRGERRTSELMNVKVRQCSLFHRRRRRRRRCVVVVVLSRRLSATPACIQHAGAHPVPPPPLSVQSAMSQSAERARVNRRKNVDHGAASRGYRSVQRLSLRISACEMVVADCRSL